MKKLCLLLLCSCALLCACSTSDLSDSTGEYILSVTQTWTENGKEMCKIVWSPDSFARSINGEDEYEQIGLYSARKLWIEENNGMGYVRTTVVGEPDMYGDYSEITSDALIINLESTPQKGDSDSENSDSTATTSIDVSHKGRDIVIENGFILCYDDDIKYLISKPIKILKNTPSQIELDNAEPFDICLTDANGTLLHTSKIQYTYDPILKSDNKIVWNVKYSIEFDKEFLKEFPEYQNTIVYFHIEGIKQTL